MRITKTEISIAVSNTGIRRVIFSCRVIENIKLRKINAVITAITSKAGSNTFASHRIDDASSMKNKEITFFDRIRLLILQAIQIWKVTAVVLAKI